MSINEKKIKISINNTLLVLFISIILIILNHLFSFSIPCIFHEITHLYCPGCGLTRMILSIMKLNFYQAFRYNPLLFIASPFIISYYITYYYNWLQDKNIKISKKTWIFFLIITIIFMMLRNIPQFNYLAPTTIK